MVLQSRALPATPPEKGSFPLDHDGVCRAAMRVYMKCLRAHEGSSGSCKGLARDYLQCRIDHALMAPEDLTQLGFDNDHPPSIK
ncbi:CHCH domain-containing protein [Plasmodiophora brassicae]